MPTAARSRVGTSEIAAAGRPASRRPCDQRGVDGAGGAEAVRAAAQDHGIAGLEAQRAGIGGDVRPALVDHADDAERHAHALDAHAVRPRPGRHDGADRIGELAHHVEAVRHGLDPRRVERQPVEEGRGRAGALASARSSAIGGEDCRLRAADGLGHGGERAVLLGGRRQRQHARGRRASRPMSRIAASSLALPWPSIALRGAFMALIRLAFSVSYHVRAGAARRR